MQATVMKKLTIEHSTIKSHLKIRGLNTNLGTALPLNSTGVHAQPHSAHCFGLTLPTKVQSLDKPTVQYAAQLTSAKSLQTQLQINANVAQYRSP